MSFDFEVKYEKTINDVMIVRPSLFSDFRGVIWTSYSPDLKEKLGATPELLHDKFVISQRDVLRGIHYDSKTYKLVTCIDGEVEQVVVDMRPSSSTYKKWTRYILNSDNNLAVLLPPMVGNGFLVKSEKAIYHYKLGYKGNYVDAHKQFTLKWNDPTVKIKWSVTKPILSERDS